ncbi:thiol:disulfide interchange protein DsbA [Mannheimia massilioguelmaensis]|uniref:thiol:disulfide interchange protein DsbA n=1 Tax=Mannheimia massilioguelmaensis TaxID=1604354 RepID=UPI0005C8F299|nr:DsbA family protein [Mannheimia massilioguelmaensis]
MKKLFIACIAALATLSFNVQATDLTEGKQYETLAQSHSAQPEVIEFFSFYCPHCYSFELEYQIPQKIKQAIPKGTEFKQYHVTFLGGISDDLTRAWALAMAIGAEDKVKTALFKAAKANTLQSMNDVRQIFLDNGVSAEQFDGGINSFAVTALYNKQINLAEQFKVRGVPDFYINNKFHVKMDGLSHDNFVQDYVDTVNGLLSK